MAIIISNSTKMVKNSEIETNEIDGQIVMMNIETGKYYSFDKTGTEIWHLLENRTTFAELVDKLVDMYNVDRETCESDTKEFLSVLASNNIITLE